MSKNELPTLRKVENRLKKKGVLEKSPKAETPQAKLSPKSKKFFEKVEKKIEKSKPKKKVGRKSKYVHKGKVKPTKS